MSQKLVNNINQGRVFEVFKEMGGKAKMRDIIKYMKNTYPEEFGYQSNSFFSNKMIALKKWGHVTRDGHGMWQIKEEYKD